MGDRESKCPSCGAPMGEGLRFCMNCGARVARRTRLPLRVIAWVSAAGILVIGVVLLSASSGPTGADGGSPDDPAAAPEVTAPSTTVAVDLRTGPLTASGVTCSRQLPDFPCAALIDGDPTTAWNAPGGGVGAQINVSFDGTRRVTAVIFENLEDEEGFTRNARPRMVEIRLTDSSAVVTAEFDLGHGPFRVVIPPDPTAGLVIRILSTYPGEHYEGHEAFDELALQELTFSGIAPTP